MDNVRNNELWQAFFTEVSEQLDNLELILADNNAETSADINQLFRDFHTIKSSCAMMDFHSMERIAHASEDYLDLVRKGKTALSKTTVNHLLGGIDWLKSELQNTKNTGNAPKENPDLVNILRSLSSEILKNQPLEKLSGEKNDSQQEQEIIEDRLSEDEIGEFASACRQELTAGLTPGEDVVKIKRSLNKLVSICNLVGFKAIASLLKKYIKVTNPLDQGRASSTAAEIIGRITSLEKQYQVDCGTSQLRALYLDTMFIDFAQLSGRLDYLLDLIEQNPDNSQIIEECENLLQRLGVSAGLFGYRQLLIFFRYVLQTIRSIRRGNIPDRHMAFYAVRQAVDFPIAEQLEDGETESVISDLQTRISDLNFSINQAMHYDGDESARENIANCLKIDTDTIALLMPDSIESLHQAIIKNKTICEIDIDMDCQTEVMDNLVNWISNNGNIIHNRSIFNSETTGNNSPVNIICFIATFEINLPAIESSLYAICTDDNTCNTRNIVKDNNAESVLPTEKKPDNATNNDTLQNTGNQTSSTLRIESHTLDSLVTQAGEMIMVHNMIAHAIHNDVFDNALNKIKEFLSAYDHNKKDNNKIDHDDISTLKSTVELIASAIHKISDNNEKMQQSVNAMQHRILDLRVIPVSSVFNRIPQLVKKMADTQGKLIKLEINGKDVRIDKGMVDILMEPLIHLVRNCIDHGIEHPADRIAAGKPAEATLTLAALQEGSTLLLEISDDGRGINTERIRESAVKKGFISEADNLSEQETCKLIFLPGFSTADVITETSGRGVGMDVVITRINHIGGDIDVHTTRGYGTKFSMTLPLSAAIQSVIMVSAKGRTYAVPQSSVVEIISISANTSRSIMGQSVLVLRNKAIPLFNFNDLVLQKGKTDNQHGDTLLFEPIDIGKANTAIIIGQGEKQIGICLDEVHGREDVFVRELHRDLRALPSISGATARGNGEIAFILNSNFLLQYAQKGKNAWLNQFATDG